MNNISIILFGYGNIGKAFHQRLLKQKQVIQKKYKAKFHFDLILRSSSYLMGDKWVDSKDTLNVFKKFIKKSPNKKYLIVDCTASKEMYNLYLEIKDIDACVIAANKVPLSLSHNKYMDLMSHLTKENIFYFYEATVGAGLPVVKPFIDLLDSGDEIKEVVGSFSGTLTYLFSDSKLPFSKRIQNAYDMAYTEPDPRIDLSGLDVARKCLVLARLMGLNLSLEDIEIENLVPESLRDIELDEFFNRLDECDKKIQEKEENAFKLNKSLCYMGKIFQSGIKVGLFEVEQTSSFYGLKGTSNLIEICSNFYPEGYLIKGPGAGVDVTVCGLISDIFKGLIILK
ncbi:MAG: hypothetical protein COB02_01850 [Candidatus Cloacimonadota bacterium]|nr:MAG: hypothetical protein COB02_01850 [Candidatus Cloacimonadota bacterium]